jgi:hypothetical protein
MLKYVTPHIPVRHSGHFAQARVAVYLSPRQAQNLRDLFDGLTDTRTTLNDGRPIDQPTKAIQWLLEQIDAEAVQARDAATLSPVVTVAGDNARTDAAGEAAPLAPRLGDVKRKHIRG